MAVEKLKIIGYEDDKFQNPLRPESQWFEVLINPTAISRSLDLTLNKEKEEKSAGAGETEPLNKIVKGRGSETLAFDILLDGTGILVSQVTHDVTALIERFKLNTYYPFDEKGALYPRVKIVYGNIEFLGMLTSMSINYSLFKKNGDPLRATISCEFSKAVSKEDQKADDQASGSIVKKSFPIKKKFSEGDSLPLMCYDVYGETAYYIAVAMDNDIQEIGKIAEGTIITFNAPNSFSE